MDVNSLGEVLKFLWIIRPHLRLKTKIADLVTKYCEIRLFQPRKKGKAGAVGEEELKIVDEIYALKEGKT